ncbi:MAG: hypothetical protein ACPGVX_04720 [Thalassobaculaceae bacterium]
MSSPAKEQANLPSWSPYPMEVAAHAAVAPEAAVDVLPAPAPTASGSEAPRISVAPPVNKPNKSKAPVAGRAPARQLGKPHARPAQRRRPVWITDDAEDAMTGKEYVHELEQFSAVEGRRIAQDTLIDVRSGEIEGLARLVAVTRGRYLAKLLDTGGSGRPAMRETEVSELRRFRETYEEVRDGLKILKEAIEAGEVKVSDVQG